jgi:hypothetical protein
VTFSDGEIDRPRSSRDERDHRRLVALANDVQRAMTALETEILDVGSACLRGPEPV